jgi:hypothetical protein
LLKEDTIKELIKLEQERLADIVDPLERKCVGAFISGLECALDE